MNEQQIACRQNFPWVGIGQVIFGGSCFTGGGRVSQNGRAEGFRKGGGGGGGRGYSPCLGCHALRVAQCGKHLIAIFQRFSASVKSIDPKS